MIGEGVLLECLANPVITEILSVSRKSTGKNHPKLKEYLVPDFLALKPGDEKLNGYDACFYCAGVSSVGMNEKKYKITTYDTTLAFARALNSKSNMSFVYVSGVGTDSSEKGKLKWARVKGKTENDLAKLPFKQVFGFRISLVEPARKQKHILSIYKYILWMLPLVKKMFPNSYCTMKQVADAMIYFSKNGYSKNVILVSDIHKVTQAK